MQQPHLRLLVKGFEVFEQRIIETTVRLSESRSPRLSLVSDASVLEADVIIVDGTDEGAMSWAEEHERLLQERMVVWIDADSPATGAKHVMLNRPILWVNLPIILTRVLDEQALNESALGQSSDADAVASQEAQENNGSSVLVVDDSKAVRDYLINILTTNGYAVTGAGTGEEAIEKVKAQYYDCVLMDVLMPGIDGYKACRQVRRIKLYPKSIPVVMLTSRTSPFDKIRGKFAGCDAYLTKPVKVKTLLTAVKKQIEKNK